MDYDNIKLSSMLEVATVAARLGGQRAMELINYSKVSEKGDQLVTDADVACQAIIISRIKENFPDHGFIGEEGDGGGIFKQAPRGSEQFWWVIDPIDGTNNFAHKMPEFSVSVAVMHKGEPIVGVIFQPATDMMFSASAGSEAQLNGSRIEAGNEKLGPFASVAVDSHYHEEIPKFICDIMLKVRFRNFGTTALETAFVGMGGLAAVLTEYPKVYDYAAGAFIAARAGAIVSNWKGEKIFPVDIENYNGESQDILVGNPKAHKEILEMMHC